MDADVDVNVDALVGPDGLRDELLAAVIEAMAEGVVVHAPDGAIVTANRSATRILGVSLDQLAGRSPLDPRWQLTRADGTPLPSAEIPSEITRTTGAPCREARLGVLHPDGERRWLSINTMPVGAPTAHGHRHVVVTITDVTEARRTADLLRRAQRLDAIGDLTAGIAHNFNNLLAVIVPNVELARRTAEGRSKQGLADAAAAASAGADLVRQLLRIVRRGEGEAREEAPITDAVAIVREVVGICRRTFDARIQITASLAAEAAPVRIPASDLHQALLNLCINARDALAGQAAPRLALELVLDPAAALLEIRVTDNGVGMTDDVQRRLGEPLFTTRAERGGTGLGVASAVGAVRDAGGALTWASAPGEGATFTLRLPVVAEALPAPAALPDLVDARDRLPGREVLVIEDDALVAQALGRLIGSLGPRVTTATHADAALALVAAAPTRFGAVLLDAGLPGGGAPVLARLRLLAPGLPVILMSGYLDSPGEPEGAFAVLVKPAARAELVRVLGAALATA